jgi:hypothetical protein
MKSKNILCPLLSLLLILVLAGGATGSAQVVTNSADSGPGTLRSAITNAASGAVITFDPGLSGATITLSNTLTINTNLTIDASALPGGLQINGNHAVQIFNVASTATVLLNSLTITGGYTATNSYFYSVGGGGIDNYGTLTLTNCTLSGNSATNGVFGGAFGGGIDNDGTLTMNQCTLSENYAYAGWGGGIDNDGNGTLTMNRCTLSGNYAYEGGGGIHNNGTLTLTNCTLSGNSGGSGGGIFNDFGTLALNGCTLSGNRAGTGGGICNYGILTLNICTLTGNSSAIGGGVDSEGIDGIVLLTLNQCTLSGNSATEGGGGINHGDAETLAMTNTIVAGNSVTTYADDIEIYGATLTYGGSNLVQSVDNGGGTIITGPGPLTNAPNLAPLGNYGGPTQTMPPLPGSPVIGAGSVAANTFSTDQRGYSRTQNGLIDLGAVELQSPAASPPVLGNIAVPAGGGNGFQFTFTNAPAADFTVLTATNVSLSLTNWTVLGEVQQIAPGQYQFTDPQAATNLVRFYRVRSP